MKRQPTLPRLWLISDARNDAGLAAALARLPRGSGFIFRHYHLPPAARQARFTALARLARQRAMVVVLAGTPAEARRWGADGAYGAGHQLARGGTGRRATNWVQAGTRGINPNVPPPCAVPRA